MQQNWRIAAGIMLVLGAGGYGLAAGPVVPLAPVSRWQMDYAPSECRLLRSFGEGKDRVTLQLSKLDLNDTIEMSLAGQRMPATDDNIDTVVSTGTVPQVSMFAQGFRSVSTGVDSIRFGSSYSLLMALRSDVSGDVPTRLGINFAHRYGVQLDLGAMKGPLSALDTCMDNLLTEWGLDPVQQRQRRSDPEPLTSPAEWFKTDDYPDWLIRRGIGGIIVMRLIVGADGQVTNCAVSKAGGDKDFEALTCQLATARIRFRPATGKDGKPIPTVWIRRVEWRPAGQTIQKMD